MSAVVSDSSPLIYVAALNDFDLLRQLHGNPLIPPAVYREVILQGEGHPVQFYVQAALDHWISVTPTPDRVIVENIRDKHRLDAGESEAIVIASQLGGLPLLMDERRGVQCARSMGLTVIRTPLIYAQAKVAGLIGDVREKLDLLRANGFWLSEDHYQRILRELGED